LRDEHKKNRRRVEAFARLIEPPEMIYELEEDGTMRSLGDPSALLMYDVIENVQEVVGEFWEKTVDIKHMLGEPQPSTEQVRRAIVHLAERGVVERDPPLAKGSSQGRTTRWRRCPVT
jgi:hypothetical protein